MPRARSVHRGHPSQPPLSRDGRHLREGHALAQGAPGPPQGRQGGTKAWEKEQQQRPSNGGGGRRRIFVIDFKGDLQASGVVALRDEVTTILAVASKQDEVLVRLDKLRRRRERPRTRRIATRPHPRGRDPADGGGRSRRGKRRLHDGLCRGSDPCRSVRDRRLHRRLCDDPEPPSAARSTRHRRGAIPGRRIQTHRQHAGQDHGRGPGEAPGPDRNRPHALQGIRDGVPAGSRHRARVHGGALVRGRRPSPSTWWTRSGRATTICTKRAAKPTSTTSRPPDGRGSGGGSRSWRKRRSIAFRSMSAPDGKSGGETESCPPGHVPIRHDRDQAPAPGLRTARPAESPRLRVFGASPLLYGFTVFLSSAVTLVLEITAGRLIAPYVGVSIYSWTSIIGVVLAGLSLGNWLGGAWADGGGANRDATSGADRRAGLVLVAAALASLGVLLVLTFVAPVIMAAELSPMGGAFVLALSLFFVPAVLLGVITPLLTTLALRHGERPGRIVGSMHALAALGSIAGTFAAGFWLIQYLGTRNILILCAAVLVALAAPFLLPPPGGRRTRPGGGGRPAHRMDHRSQGRIPQPLCDREPVLLHPGGAGLRRRALRGGPRPCARPPRPRHQPRHRTGDARLALHAPHRRAGARLPRIRGGRCALLLCGGRGVHPSAGGQDAHPRCLDHRRRDRPGGDGHRREGAVLRRNRRADPPHRRPDGVAAARRRALRRGDRRRRPRSGGALPPADPRVRGAGEVAARTGRAVRAQRHRRLARPAAREEPP